MLDAASRSASRLCQKHACSARDTVCLDSYMRCIIAVLSGSLVGFTVFPAHQLPDRT